MSLEGQMTHEIYQIFTWQLHVKRRKKLKAVRGSYLLFVIKHALFPLGTTSLLVSCSDLWGVCVQTLVKHANFLPHHLGGMTLHQPRFHVFLIFILFFGIKMPCHSMLNCVIVVRPICLKIPFNLLLMELNRTQVHEIWVFKPLWLAVACTCSSNFNYGH